MPIDVSRPSTGPRFIPGRLSARAKAVHARPSSGHGADMRKSVKTSRDNQTPAPVYPRGPPRSNNRTSVEHQLSARASAARHRLTSDYDADLRNGVEKYRDSKTTAKVYSRGPPRGDRRRSLASQPPKRADPVHNPKRRISNRAATTLGTARFERHDINDFQGKSHGSLDRKAQRLGRRTGKLPTRGRDKSPPASYGAVRFQTRSLRHVGGGAKFVLVTGEVAVPVDELDDFLRIPTHTLVFHKVPAPTAIEKADAATTIQRCIRGFLTRAQSRRQQAAAIILQRRVRGIVVRQNLLGFVFIAALRAACDDLATEERALNRRQQAAAIVLQRHARGFAIRQRPGGGRGVREPFEHQDSPKVRESQIVDRNHGEPRLGGGHEAVLPVVIPKAVASTTTRSPLHRQDLRQGLLRRMH